MTRPDPSEHAPYYAKYVALVAEDDVLGAMESQLGELLSLFRDVANEEAERLHPPYTWSAKQVVGHLVDGERIFAYRALRFARGDSTELPGFEENSYAREGGFDRLPLSALLDEFEAVRRSSLCLFRHMPEGAESRRGVANGAEVSVRALATIMVGHVRHHEAILRRRLGGACGT